MCYSFSLTASEKNIFKRFKVQPTNGLSSISSYYRREAFSNQTIYIIPQGNPSEIYSASWGFITDFGRDKPAEFLKKYSTYNARSERLFESNLYKDAILNKRCLIVADGFFEPHHTGNGSQAYYCYQEGNKDTRKLFAFAGIYNELSNDELSASIITTAANPLFEFIHNKKKRMPFVLDSSFEREWISGLNPNQIKELLKVGITTDEFSAYPITKDFYKNRSLDTAEVIEPKGKIITEANIPKIETYGELPFPTE